MNIEKAIIKYLGSVMPDTVVCGDVPNPRPKKLVTVERTGGSADSIVLDRPQLAVQCWAETRVEAADLAYEVDSLIAEIDDQEIPEISRSSLYNYPDEDGNPRYQIVYDAVTYR